MAERNNNRTAIVCPYMVAGAPLRVALRVEPSGNDSGWRFNSGECEEEAAIWTLDRATASAPEFRGLLEYPPGSLIVNESGIWVLYETGEKITHMGIELNPYGERDVYIPGATREEIMELARRWLKSDSTARSDRARAMLEKRVLHPEPGTVAGRHFPWDLSDEKFEAALEATVDELMAYKAIELGPPEG